MGIKKRPSPVKKQIERKKIGQHKGADDYFDLHSCVELLDVKRILENRQEYIELTSGGYLQMLEVSGKDLDSLSEAEVRRTLSNFDKWLTRFSEDWTI